MRYENESATLLLLSKERMDSTPFKVTVNFYSLSEEWVHKVWLYLQGINLIPCVENKEIRPKDFQIWYFGPKAKIHLTVSSCLPPWSFLIQLIAKGVWTTALFGKRQGPSTPRALVLTRKLEFSSLHREGQRCQCAWGEGRVRNQLRDRPAHSVYRSDYKAINIHHETELMNWKWGKLHFLVLCQTVTQSLFLHIFFNYLVIQAPVSSPSSPLKISNGIQKQWSIQISLTQTWTSHSLPFPLPCVWHAAFPVLSAFPTLSVYSAYSAPQFCKLGPAEGRDLPVFLRWRIHTYCRPSMQKMFPPAVNSQW